jgi:hypothetical protein
LKAILRTGKDDNDVNKKTAGCLSTDDERLLKALIRQGSVFACFFLSDIGYINLQIFYHQRPHHHHHQL